MDNTSKFEDEIKRHTFLASIMSSNFNGMKAAYAPPLKCS